METEFMVLFPLRHHDRQSRAIAINQPGTPFNRCRRQPCLLRISQHQSELNWTMWDRESGTLFWHRADKLGLRFEQSSKASCCKRLVGPLEADYAPILFCSNHMNGWNAAHRCIHLRTDCRQSRDPQATVLVRPDTVVQWRDERGGQVGDGWVRHRRVRSWETSRPHRMRREADPGGHGLHHQQRGHSHPGPGHHPPLGYGRQDGTMYRFVSVFTSLTIVLRMKRLHIVLWAIDLHLEWSWLKLHPFTLDGTHDRCIAPCFVYILPEEHQFI